MMSHVCCLAPDVIVMSQVVHDVIEQSPGKKHADVMDDVSDPRTGNKHDHVMNDVIHQRTGKSDVALTMMS